ncbi:3'(2'),5'-bisphosphate nucleotidase 1 [Agrilus planipennis]|uniref:3'(2'),5'-bisphosphate nucleotidase 1 n=1 Tax=Agrilus planipennis TaxID=224129 RepID=A0A1W4XCE3_AGRPL|nr:3'(2'),5'-bisphosphate nucleotidase 1 [Agrilus planipennis]XP_018333679.1 3'(2'),5'-bisphosphate nucleotidase 1 [Agrilus planipennis]
MASSSSLVLRIIASSVTAANRAGKIIRDILTAGDLGIVEKGKNDLQTEADRAAQRCIVASLSRQYPNLNIIGEEEQTSNVEVPSDWVVTDCEQSVLLNECPPEYQQIPEEDIVVWVDPLDGTSEFTQGLLEHVTVLIGVAVKGKAIGGVIHQPYYNYKSNSNSFGRTIWGLIGLGVEGLVLQAAPLGTFIVTTTRSHSNTLVTSALDALHPDEVLRVGGAGYKVLLLIEGKAHAYVFASAGCKKWDTCAPEAILNAIGGKLTNLSGVPYSYDKDVQFPNSGGVLATAKGIDHDDIISKIPQNIKEALK